MRNFGAESARWPELLRPATAARMLDMALSTFSMLWPILVANYGLKILGICGPKFRRDNLLDVLSGLADKGLDISIDKAAGVVKIGSKTYPKTSSRSGKSRRGRPVEEAAA